MNPQALMKQYREIMKEQERINNTTFEGENSLVKVKVNGKKEVLEVKIDRSTPLEEDDLESLEDMILLAVNNAMNKVDKEVENKLGKYTNGLPGFF